MPIRNHITDPATNKKAVVDHPDNEDNGLVVATRPLKTYDNVIKFFTNNEYGIAMNQNAISAGTPEKVHNGTDDTLWTGSEIVGDDVTFDSLEEYHAGSKSIHVDAWDQDDVFQLAKGSDLNCAGYVSITMWIYPDRRWASPDIIEIYGWDVNTNSQVGNAVDLSDYFTYDDYDIWHKLTISLSNFGILASSTINALRIKYTNSGWGNAEFYVDDIQFEAAGGGGEPIEYKVEPDEGTWLHVSGLKFIMADAYTGTVSDGTMSSLPYNAFLGVSKLDTGITYKRVQAEEIISSANIQQLLDVMSFSNAEITSSGSDGTNTWYAVQITFTEPIILKSEDADYMSFTVNDNLSGLLEFKSVASAKTEERE